MNNDLRATLEEKAGGRGPYDGTWRSERHYLCRFRPLAAMILCGIAGVAALWLAWGR